MTLLLRDLEELPTFDTETTGVDAENERIVTAFIGLINRKGELTRTHEWLINPGIPIPDGAAAVHGVTTELAQAKGRDPFECISEIHEVLRELTANGAPVVAYNGRYDFMITDREARRHGITPLESPRVIDPFVIDKHIDKYRKGSRKLIDASAHYGITLENAHTADADAIAAGRIAWQQIDRLTTATATVDELHEKQIRWAREQAISLEEYFIKKWRENTALAEIARKNIVGQRAALEGAMAELAALEAESAMAWKRDEVAERVGSLTVAVAEAEEAAAFAEDFPRVEKVWPVPPIPTEVIDDELADEFDLV